MIDIGANLTDDVFTFPVSEGKEVSCNIEELDFVILRAITHNVSSLILTGGDLQSSLSAISTARKYNSKESIEKHSGILRNSLPGEVADTMISRRSQFRLAATVGVHPCHANQFESTSDLLNKLQHLIEDNLDVVVAVGECGLDYDRENFCVREIQQRHFPCHFQLAARFNLPLFFHNRNTAGDFVRVLASHNKPGFEGVVHSYTGELSEMQDLLKAGLYIGVNGCSLKTEENCSVVSHIPMDRLLLETDAPYCEIRASHAGFKYFQSALEDFTLNNGRHNFSYETKAFKKPKYLQALSEFNSLATEGRLSFETAQPFSSSSAFGITLKGRNEPSRISEVALAVYQIKKSAGNLKEMNFSEFLSVIQQNTKRLFRF
ncbi:deoxyribonuclease tatD [Perkinsela sp. CCAP 1560/4]|nr:deoxyribonuclease tatD [Perkinsela sp. CCAP 1560/4]|eukprot:KNH04363.1 deoxyribonuclease tatD [Perkinsela sp. CCAP 1560/4]